MEEDLHLHEQQRKALQATFKRPEKDLFLERLRGIIKNELTERERVELALEILNDAGGFQIVRKIEKESDILF